VETLSVLKDGSNVHPMSIKDIKDGDSPSSVHPEQYDYPLFPIFLMNNIRPAKASTKLRMTPYTVIPLHAAF